MNDFIVERDYRRRVFVYRLRDSNGRWHSEEVTEEVIQASGLRDINQFHAIQERRMMASIIQQELLTTFMEKEIYYPDYLRYRTSEKDIPPKKKEPSR